MSLLWLLLWVAQAAVPDLAIELKSESDPCSLQELAPRAIARAFPGLRIVSRTNARHVLEIRSRASIVEIALLDREELVLERRIPLRTDACTAAADGIALIVERYFRDLGFEPPKAALPAVLEAPPPSTTPAETRTSTAARIDAVVETRGEETDSSTSTSAKSRTPVHLLFSARFFASTEFSSAELSGGLGAHFRISFFDLAAEVGMRTPTSQAVLSNAQTIGELGFASWFVWGGPGACFGFEPSTLCLNARAGVERVTGDPSGEMLFQQAAAAFFTPLTALEARYEWAFASHFIVSAAVFGLWRPGPPLFEIEGTTFQYQVPEFALGGTLGMMFSVF